MRVIVNTRKLDEIARNSNRRANEILQKLAQDMEGDVKNSFSADSPSSPGSPPGVDTGNLKNSIIAEPEGNDWVVHDGVSYGVHLEFGTSRMGARPFMRPALLRVIKNAPDELLRIVE